MTRHALKLAVSAALILLVTAPSADAARLYRDASRNENLGPGNYNFWGYVSPSRSPFTDLWGFSLQEPARVGLIADSLDISIGDFSILGIDDLQVFFSGQSAAGGEWLSALLPAGAYQFRITGDPSGILGGKYIGRLGVRPTPLPPAIILFGSALLLTLGFRKLQRSRNAS